MNEIKFSLPKTVKKTTYNEVINTANRKIIPSNPPNEGKPVYRSKSFKHITNFVPILKPKKSSYLPTPLRLNDTSSNFNLNKEKNETDKQSREDEIDVIEESDSSDCSSSSMSSSFINTSEDEDEEIKAENKESKGTIEKNDENCDTNDNKEEKNNSQDKENEDKKLLKEKESHLKENIKKETEELVPENLINNCDIEKSEKEPNTINYEKNNGIKLRPKSIFEVISISRNGIKK